MHNYRNFKDYHIERLRDQEDAEIYLSVALEDYKEDKDQGAFRLAVNDVKEVQDDNFLKKFLKKAGIFEEVSELTWEGLADLRAGEIVGIDHTSETSEDLTILVDRFFQWFRQVFRSFFFNPLAVSRVGFGVLVLVVGAVYLGSRYFYGGVDDTALGTRKNGITPEQVKPELVKGGGVKVSSQVKPELVKGERTRKSGIVPMPVEPTLVKGAGVKVSPFGFGAFPRIPADFPDQDIWNKVKKRSISDPNGAKTLELLARVRIELWNQGKRTKGVIMDSSSGLIYSDSEVEILPDVTVSSAGHEHTHNTTASPILPDVTVSSTVPKYNAYFDDGFTPSERIVVKFLEGGIEPYKFLNLPR